MAGPTRRVNRSTTDRLSRLVEAELKRQRLTAEEAARAARLPAKVFRALLRHRQRPALDRADEICRALGISMTIGAAVPDDDNEQEGDAERN